jgi:hypothetical protein
MTASRLSEWSEAMEADVADHGAEAARRLYTPAEVVQPQRSGKQCLPGCLALNYGAHGEGRQDLKNT